MGKNIRWIIVLLLFLVYMINYLDRVALSITVPMIEKDLALNAEQFGIIFGSFFFGNDSNLLIVFYVQIVPDDFVMQLHRF